MKSGAHKPRRAETLACALLLLVSPAGASEFEYEAPKPGSYKLPVIRPAADAQLIDSTGKKVRMADLARGRVALVSFIYTRCRDAGACPYATSVLNQVHGLSQTEKDLAREVRLLTVTFDPGHDTPERMAEYGRIMRDHEGGAEWRFLSPASPGELASLLRAYDQAVDQATNPAATGPLKHTLRVYLVDPEQRIRNIYSSGTLDPRLVMADIRTLLLERAKP